MNAGGSHRGRVAGEPPVVLIVEDETLVRMAIVGDLSEAGYRVIEAASAAEALDVLDGGHVVDLVFSDIRMPGAIDGVGLVDAIRQRFPTLPVVLTSAHTLVAPGAHEGVVFVPKPYSSHAVVALIHKRIGAKVAQDGVGAA